jgi:hypothetical protein
MTTPAATHVTAAVPVAASDLSEATVDVAKAAGEMLGIA